MFNLPILKCVLDYSLVLSSDGKENYNYKKAFNSSW